MSPISAEMNGNVAGAGKEMSSSANSKSILDDSSSTEADGGNFSGSDSQPSSGRPLTTSTPLADQSHEDSEQPTSSTGSNYGFSAPKFGTLIPNRIFVGGISCHTTEGELMQLFSKFGAVRATKIIMDRAGVSKGYGFVTFETEEEAKRLYNAMNNREMPPIVHRERRLNIAPAVKKQVIQPMVRQNIPYSSHGAAACALSPPPYDTTAYFYNQPHLQNQQGQQHPHPSEFFCPPVPIPDSYFPPSSGFSQAPIQSSGPMQSFYAPVPPTAQNPNGTVYYIPFQYQTTPYQQAPGNQDQWTGTFGSGGGGGSSMNMNSGSQWRCMNPGLPSLSLPQNSLYGCHSQSGGLSSTQSISSPPHHHQFLQEHLLGQASAFAAAQQDPYFYISSALISSPH